MFSQILVLSIVLLSVAFLGLGIGILFSKKKKFPNTTVGGNKALRKKGVYCAKTEQAIIDKNFKVKKLNTGCAACDM